MCRASRSITRAAFVAALFVVGSLCATGSALFTDLGGAEVRDQGGSRLGELKDVVFDARDGQIVALTVDYGRWLHVSEYEAAFAPDKFVRRDGAFELAMDETALRRARRVERPAWPLVRASDLVGRRVRDRLQRDSGEMVDLILDLEARRVEAAVVDIRDDWEPQPKLRRVALGELSLPRDVGQYATLNVPREQLWRDR